MTISTCLLHRQEKRIRVRIGADDDPGVCIFMQPTLPASAAQRSYADAWCSPGDRLRQTGRSLCSTARVPLLDSRSSFTTNPFNVGEFRRIGSPSLNALDFTIGPRIRPRSIRGGRLSPGASSKPAVQCAIACAGFILPHWRSLSGRRCAILSFTSCTLAASNRFSWSQPTFIPAMGMDWDLGCALPRGL